MSNQNANRPPIPKWAWIFAGACLIIPIFTLGGLIPSAIGGFSGFAVIAIARQAGKPARKKVLYCGVITGSAWTVFVVFLFAWTALQNQYPSLNPQRPKRATSASSKTVTSRSELTSATQTRETVLTDEKRREIYEMAMRTRSHIEFAREQGSTGRHIERLEEMHEKRLEFTTRFHRITREQLDDIIAEGEASNWPRE